MNPDQDQGIPTAGICADPSIGLVEKRTIGWAIKQMQNGCLVTRAGWNGKGQFLGLQRPDAHSVNTLPYVWIVTVQNKRVPWICSQVDLLAMDWELMGGR